MLAEISILLLSAFLFVYYWFRVQYSYWDRKQIPSIRPSLFFGNLKDLVFMRKASSDIFADLYNNPIGKNSPYIGIYVFHKPALLLRDPELIKKVLIKDFNSFQNHYTYLSPHTDPIGGNMLFMMKTPMWRDLRQKLTPFFTSGKLRNMFPLVDSIGDKLDDYLKSLSSNSSPIVDLKEVCSLYTTDVIASVAFGFDANSLNEPNGDFRRNGRKIFDFHLKTAISFFTAFFLHQLSFIIRPRFLTQETSHFLVKSIDYAMAERKKSGVARNDLIDTLLQFEKEGYPKNVIVGQAAIFWLAGFETTSSVMTFLLLELVRNQEIQDKLREEIKEFLIETNGKFDYDKINSMEYLNMVVQESARMYSTLPFLDRECLEGYQVDEELHIPKGTPVFVPNFGIARDPKYFDEPNKFDPERFHPSNKQFIDNVATMPFGTGPRSCIGERLGLIQVKVGIFNFLRNHKLVANEKTVKDVIIDPMALVVTMKGKMYCDVVRDTMVDL
ncbi:Cyp6g1.2 family protein [Megaselia abdita]